MERKAIRGIMLTLLLIGMLTLAFQIQPVKASGTIYIRADGSIYPPTAPISSVDNITYTFTGNIYDEIVVERNSIVVDGAGYTIQGTGAWGSRGISLFGRSNVTIKNMQIKAFHEGIRLFRAHYNSISRNNITNNWEGIWLDRSLNNIISRNNIINNRNGILLFELSNYTSISGNNITNNARGVGLGLGSDNNTVYGNNITNNWGDGIYLYESSNNKFYHNNFIDNTQQVYIETSGFANVWDDGYPSGGNYWSDYSDVDLFSGPYQNETGSDGIWDHPYTIDASNQDRYPLVNPWTPLIPFVTATIDIDPDTLNLKSKGEWITCYIELPEGYNVSDIDVSTILLNDTVPAEWSDIQNDVLMVKFNRAEVIDLMTVGNQTIKITGELTDGTPFEGTDMIRAIHAQITLTNVRTIRLDVDGAFLQGENLKVRFYGYSGEYQGETTVWSGTTPAQIDLSLDLSQNSPIENAIFILTDNEENTILNLVNFVVHKSDLFSRIVQTEVRWPFAPSSERITLFRELADISKQWPYAPP